MQIKSMDLKSFQLALAGVAQWIVPTCQLQGHGFYFQSGHMPGLWTRSPVGDA